MEKNRLYNFIQKYYLNGLVEGTKIHVRDNKITTDFITEDRSTLGHITYNNIDIEDTTFGVFDTSQLVRMLNVLDNDINVNIVKVSDKPVNMKMVSTSGTQVTALLADLSVIADVPVMKKIPEFGLTFNVDEAFVNMYSKSKTALPDTDTFTIVPNNGSTKLVLGMSSVNTNRISLPLTDVTLDDPLLDNKTINANVFKEILSVNKGTEAKVELADAGLLRISYNDKDYTATYYLKTIENE